MADKSLNRALRIGTAEREKAVGDLGEHFAAGRLDADEYADRVGQAYAARFGADLGRLFADLPAMPPPAPRPRPTQRHEASMRIVLLALFVLVIVAAAASAREHIPPFFIFPLIWFLMIRAGWRARHRHY